MFSTRQSRLRLSIIDTISISLIVFDIDNIVKISLTNKNHFFSYSKLLLRYVKKFFFYYEFNNNLKKKK